MRSRSLVSDAVRTNMTRSTGATVPLRNTGDRVSVLECLKKHGQRLDVEIAHETGISLESVRAELTSLADTGAVILCKLTRFEGTRPLTFWQCRVSGYFPPKAPGRKPVSPA